MKMAAFGGPYSNPYALRALLTDAALRGCERIVCLGDLGGFGAEPEALWDLLVSGEVECIAGNYDVAIGRGDPDCGCGYRDPQDNAFAQIAYDYTAAHVSAEFAAWMRSLPTERRETVEGVEIHLVHGSPLGLNDFFWESSSEPDARRRVAASGADLILCTHTGLPWQRRVGGALVVNVGVLGRPANDGRRDVWYAVVDVADGRATAELVPLAYDWASQAASMRAAGLPEAFVETITGGWWASCLQVLPPPERSRGRYQLYRSELAPGDEDDGLTPSGSGSPVERSDLPVVALFGTALFRRRLWLLDPGLADAKLARRHAEAAAEGFIEVRTGRPLVNTGPELTLTPDGWYQDPSLSLQVAGPEVATAEAKRLVTEQILTEAQASGRLGPPHACDVPQGRHERARQTR